MPSIAEIVQQAIQGLQVSRATSPPVLRSLRPGAVEMQQILDSRTGGPRAVLYLSAWRFRPQKFEPRSVGHQVGGRGRAVNNPPRVVVLDARGWGIEGMPVLFTVVKGDGQLVAARRLLGFPNVGLTDVWGVAELERWTLGDLGDNVVRAEIPGDDHTFVADAQEP